MCSQKYLVALKEELPTNPSPIKIIIEHFKHLKISFF